MDGEGCTPRHLNPLLIYLIYLIPRLRVRGPFLFQDPDEIPRDSDRERAREAELRSDELDEIQPPVDNSSS